MSTLRICLWSGPRNVSTALMYSFAQRSDTRALDEPLYAHYLSVTGAEHPGKDEVLASMEQDGERVVRDVILGPCDRPVLFMKQMAHHLVNIDRSFLKQTINILLVRDPEYVLPSLATKLPTVNLRDTGLAIQCELLQQLREWGQEPLVLDSSDFFPDTAGLLNTLCERIGIPFEEAMLRWPAGPHPEDGVWAPYWYHTVHSSTGFERPAEAKSCPPHLKPLLEECRPYYALLKATAMKAGEHL
ncbi:MAG: sulfotransferase family protein [Pyrinomonadaceae bacterium]|nr:sulfotransferase family protein [Pyrinomonadaceae bacterium]MBD0372776.1 sulfotransferase family protein [Pyrinomonadaceae bacterium]